MAAAWIFLWTVGLIGLAGGERIFHLRDDGVYDQTTLFLRLPIEASAHVTMCYNGVDVFVAEGILGSETSMVYSVPANNTDPDIEPFIYQVVEGTHHIVISCCCQYVAYGFPDATSKQYRIHFRSLEQPSIFKEFVVEDPVRIAALNLFCDTSTIRLTTSSRLYEFDLMNAGAPAVIHELGGLMAPPRCAAMWSEGGVEYLFTSYDDRDQFQVTPLDDDPRSLDRIFTYTVLDTEQVVVLKTACVTVEGDRLYSFSRRTNEGIGNLINVSVSDVINNPTEGTFIEIRDTDPITFSVEDVGDYVNGISLCSDCASSQCIVESSTICEACADPGFEECGFCSADRTECICSQTQETGCTLSPRMEAMCVRPTEKIDAYCVVYNPMAERRGGGPNGVAVAVGAVDEPMLQSSRILRAAGTGRYRKVLPESVPINRGLLFPVQNRAHGKRFALFAGNVDRVDGITESLYCLTTEKSAFTNKAYTYTTYQGGSVTLEVEMENIEYLHEVRWRKTNLDTDEVTELGNRGSLTLIINDADKANDEGSVRGIQGVEANDDMASFHVPLREGVSPDRYGFGCTNECPVCGNGICDVRTGTCRCRPGFTGEDCLIPCATASLIGQHCDIHCGDLFPDAGEDCKNLLICGAEDMGCGCRSGMKMPDCMEDCDPGTWGYGCTNSCTVCADGQLCHPRIGCV